MEIITSEQLPTRTPGLTIAQLRANQYDPRKHDIAPAPAQVDGFRLMVRDLLHAADMDMGISLEDTEQRIVDAYEARMLPLTARLIHAEHVMAEAKRWMRRTADKAGVKPPVE